MQYYGGGVVCAGGGGKHSEGSVGGNFFLFGYDEDKKHSRKCNCSIMIYILKKTLKRLEANTSFTFLGLSKTA